jgi:hypothetical protein
MFARLPAALRYSSGTHRDRFRARRESPFQGLSCRRLERSSCGRYVRSKRGRKPPGAPTSRARSRKPRSRTRSMTRSTNCAPIESAAAVIQGKADKPCRRQSLIARADAHCASLLSLRGCSSYGDPRTRSATSTCAAFRIRQEPGRRGPWGKGRARAEGLSAKKRKILRKRLQRCGRQGGVDGRYVSDN